MQAGRAGKLHNEVLREDRLPHLWQQHLLGLQSNQQADCTRVVDIHETKDKWRSGKKLLTSVQNSNYRRFLNPSSVLQVVDDGQDVTLDDYSVDGNATPETGQVVFKGQLNGGMTRMCFCYYIVSAVGKRQRQPMHKRSGSLCNTKQTNPRPSSLRMLVRRAIKLHEASLPFLGFT